MKRLIGEFVLAGLLSGASVVAVAGPSLAVRDDPCMDMANSMRQEVLFTDAESAAVDYYMAWQNADHYVNPVSGEETWAAATNSGTIYVHTLGSYNWHLVDSADAYIEELAAHYSFELNVDICP